MILLQIGARSYLERELNNQSVNLSQSWKDLRQEKADYVSIVCGYVI